MTKMDEKIEKKVEKALEEEMRKKDFAEIKSPEIGRKGDVRMADSAGYMDIVDAMSRKPLPPVSENAE